MTKRTLHYFWEGGKKPRLVRKCLASWARVMPGCTIKEWNLKRLAEAGIEIRSRFFDETVALGKWGFVIDVVRWAVLAKEGGIFLDADVELLKPLPDGIWLSAEKDNPLVVNPGQGVSFPARHPFILAALKEYEKMAFDPDNMVACASPHVITRMLGRADVPKILPARMMNPLGWSGGRLGRLAEDCCSIHWYAATWFNWKQRLVYKTFPRLGIDVGRIIRWFRR